MSIFQSIGNFVAKEVTGAEKTLAAIGAFLKKEEPNAQAIINAAVADYNDLIKLEQSASVIQTIDELKNLVMDVLATLALLPK